MKRGYKAIVAELEDLGFTYDRTNSKGIDYYTHPLCHEIGVSANIDTSAGKRHPQQIKLRQAAERKAITEALTRHEAELATLRQAQLEGLDGVQLAEGDLRALEDKVAELRARDRQLAALMAAPTATGDRVKHRAGAER